MAQFAQARFKKMAARLVDKRRRRRIDVALPIKIEYNNEEISTGTKNISVLGAYIESEKEIPRDISLDIKITIPERQAAETKEAKQISCKGITFRSRPIQTLEAKKQYGAGIFFRSFLEGGEKDLAEYIDYFLLQEKKKEKIYLKKSKQRLSKRKGGGEDGQKG